MRLGQRFSTLLIAAMAVLGLTMPIHAAFVSGLINVDFNSGGPTPTATGPAVIGQSGDVWNGFSTASGSNLPLVSADNDSTDVTITYSAGGTYYAGSWASPVNPALLQDYLHRNGTETALVTIFGLSDSVTYDLYLYSASNSIGRVTDLEVTGSTTLNGSVTFASLTTYSSGQNYLKFTLAPDSNGEILIAFKRGSVGTEGNMNGFQITPVPEPASLSAISLAALGLLRRRRQ